MAFVTTAADQVLFDKHNRFSLRCLTIGAGFELSHLSKRIPVDRIVSVTLHQTSRSPTIEHFSGIRHLKLVGDEKWFIPIIQSFACASNRLKCLSLVTPEITSLLNVLGAIFSLSLLSRLEIHVNELTDNLEARNFTISPSKIQQFVLDSSSTLDWNNLANILQKFTSIRHMTIGLISRNQKLLPLAVLSNIRTLNLDLLEVPFQWIIELMKTATSLLKLKLTGLVDEDGYVTNQKWNCLLETAPSLSQIIVNVSVQQENELFYSDNIVMSLNSLKLCLLCIDDETDHNTYYGKINRWWNLSGMITKQHS